MLCIVSLFARKSLFFCLGIPLGRRSIKENEKYQMIYLHLLRTQSRVMRLIISCKTNVKTVIDSLELRSSLEKFAPRFIDCEDYN